MGFIMTKAHQPITFVSGQFLLQTCITRLYYVLHSRGHGLLEETVQEWPLYTKVPFVTVMLHLYFTRRREGKGARQALCWCTHRLGSTLMLPRKPVCVGGRTCLESLKYWPPPPPDTYGNRPDSDKSVPENSEYLNLPIRYFEGMYSDWISKCTAIVLTNWQLLSGWERAFSTLAAWSPFNSTCQGLKLGPSACMCMCSIAAIGTPSPPIRRILPFQGCSCDLSS